MAECNFILAPADQHAFFTFLVEMKAHFIPAIAYQEPKPLRISGVHELEQLVRDNVLVGPVFVVWQDISDKPFTFYQIDKEGQTRFFLKQRAGGPYLNLLPSKSIERDNQNILSSGFVGYHRFYWIEQLKKEMPVSVELKERYRAVTKFLGSVCTKAKAGSRAYWVGGQAKDLISRGAITGIDNLVV